jgi:hypothetical protein
MIWVICDTSGSMNEGGKKLLVRTLLTYLSQLPLAAPRGAFPGSLRVVAWGDGARLVELEADISPLRCEGRVSANALTAFLTQALEEASRPRLLLVSDGQWPPEELQHLRRWLRTRPDVAVQAIAVGADANRRDLGAVAGPSRVFAPEDIWAVLEAWDDADATAPAPRGQPPGRGDVAGGGA